MEIQVDNSSSPTGVWYHLGKKYGIKKETQENLVTKAARKSKKQKISTFFQKRPIEEVTSRLTALDVLSFKAIVNNPFIRCLKKVLIKKNKKQTIQSVKKFAAGVRTLKTLSILQRQLENAFQ